MPQLDPDARAVLEVLEASGAPGMQAMGVTAARERVRASLVSRRSQIPLADVEDGWVATPNGRIATRIYRPNAGTVPAAMFIHGGGWTLNDLDTHDELCRKLAKQSGCAIVSIDFRRAPEHKHPAALEDAYSSYRWMLDNADDAGFDSRRIAIAGESSGATTTAALALMLRDAGAPLPVKQLLIYPATDTPGRWPSYTERGSGYILDRDLMEWYVAQCVPAGADLRDPYLFPLAATDLSGLPPAFVLTAEFDPLRDEGAAYARRLAEASVEVDHLHADDQMHGFLLLSSVVPRADYYIRKVARALSAVRTA